MEWKLFANWIPDVILFIRWLSHLCKGPALSDIIPILYYPLYSCLLFSPSIPTFLFFPLWVM